MRRGRETAYMYNAEILGQNEYLPAFIVPSAFKPPSWECPNARPFYRYSGVFTGHLSWHTECYSPSTFLDTFHLQPETWEQEKVNTEVMRHSHQHRLSAAETREHWQNKYTGIIYDQPCGSLLAHPPPPGPWPARWTVPENCGSRQQEEITWNQNARGGKTFPAVNLLFSYPRVYNILSIDCLFSKYNGLCF